MSVPPTALPPLPFADSAPDTGCATAARALGAARTPVVVARAGADGTGVADGAR